MLLTRIWACLFFFLISIHAFPQTTYQKGYFMYPIKPGTQSFLSGNMGELRSNHFHAGLDIKTGGGTGLPVYAAADGYVGRVTIMAKGYGMLVTLVHPNGLSTLYAHLQGLEPKLFTYVKQKQTEQQTFEINIDFKPGQFAYRKGDVLAYSGNSGSSGGPHLHFEVRDAQNNYLNPLLFGFNEVKDNIAPVVMKAAFRTFGENSRVNGEFGRTELSLVKTGINQYATTTTVYVRGIVGLELNAYDFMNGPHNFQGINVIDVQLDGKQIFNFNLEKYSREESVNINSHIDYETAQRLNSFYHKCYVADGNFLSSYKSVNKGKIFINDDENHAVKVRVEDAYGNFCTYTVNLKGGLPAPKPIVMAKAAPKFNYRLFENVMKITYRGKDIKNNNLSCSMYVKGTPTELPSSYFKNNESVYLWNLTKGIPDSMVFCDDVKYFNDIKFAVYPNQITNISTPDINVSFPKNSLFDTLYLRLKKNKDTWELHDYTVPFASEISITLKNTGEIANKSQTSAYAKMGAGLRYGAGTWNGNDLEFKTRFPGHFVIRTDKTPPKIVPIRKTKSSIEFTINDYPSGIKRFDCYVNGVWTLMYYDYKKAKIWAEKIDKTIPFTGELVLKVTDNAGNVATYKSVIKNK